MKINFAIKIVVKIKPMKQNNLEKAKAKLMLEYPFFGEIASNLEIKNNTSIAAVNFKGDKLEINYEYLEVLSLDEIATILANAAMKQLLFHKERSKGKVQYLWDIASDFAINELLAKNGFSIPPLLNYSSRFERLSAEEIYTILLSEQDIKEQEEEQEKEKIIDDNSFNEFLEAIIKKHLDSDNLPEGIEEFIPSAKKSIISWRELLYKYINYHAKIDYRLFPSNKKHLWRGIALPSIYSDKLKIAIAIDTSASIEKAALEQFLKELEAIIQSFRDYEIELIECDYKIQRHQRLLPLMPLHSSLKGGGATDFRPVFEHIEKLREDFRFLIYFSDGEGIYPKRASIETLWVLTKESSPPFGEKIILKRD
jgi:predicted metal-dependent peptidase